jgi:hypothetical protein
MSVLFLNTNPYDIDIRHRDLLLRNLIPLRKVSYTYSYNSLIADRCKTSVHFSEASYKKWLVEVFK